MPTWTRDVIRSGDYALAAADAARSLSSDASLWGEFTYARSARAFIDVEFVDAGAELRIYRWAGPSADKLRRVDSAPVDTIVGPALKVVDWPTGPLAPFGRLEVVIARTTAGDKTACLRVIQTLSSE